MKSEKMSANSYYIGLVQNLFAGANGCFVTFMQFFYQQFLAKTNFVAFENCFEELVKKEIENCQILSESLLKMGGDPHFFSSSKKFVSGQSVNYSKEIDKIFLMDIELLEINVLDLKSAISKIENKEIKSELKKVLDNKKNSLKMLKVNYFKNNSINV